MLHRVHALPWTKCGDLRYYLKLTVHPPHWHILSTLGNLPELEEALNRFPGRDPIIMGDLNIDARRLQNPRNQQVDNFLASFVLVDIIGHFRQRLWFCHIQTWWKVRSGNFLQSLCKYILRINHCLFETVGIRYLHNFSSDHFTLRNQLLR